MNQGRFGLLGIFVLCLLAQLVAFFLVGSKMWPEDQQALVLKIIAVYSLHLSVILGGIFAQPKGRLEDPPDALAWTAIALAILWNALLIWRSITFVAAKQDSVQDLVRYLDGVSSASSFLVTGALAFFFTKGTEIARGNSESSSPLKSRTTPPPGAA